MKLLLLFMLIGVSGPKMSPELSQLLIWFHNQMPESQKDYEYTCVDVIYNNDAAGVETLVLRANPLNDLYIIETEIRHCDGEDCFNTKEKRIKVRYDLEYDGMLIRLVGKNNRFFSTGIRHLKQLNYDDAYEWVLSFKNGKINQYLTYKVSNTQIDDILSIFEEMDEEETNLFLDDYVFKPYWIERAPKFSESLDRPDDIIIRHFIDVDTEEWINLAIGEFVIDKYGNATFLSLTKSTDNEIIDSEIRTLCDSLCQHRFIPAMHRGRNVNSYYSIPFIPQKINRNKREDGDLLSALNHFSMLIENDTSKEYSYDFLSRFTIPNTVAGYIVLPIGDGRWELIENEIVRDQLYLDLFSNDYENYSDFLYALFHSDGRINIPQDFIIPYSFIPDARIEREARINPKEFCKKYLVQNDNSYQVKKKYADIEPQILKACFDNWYFIYYSCLTGTWSIKTDLMYLPQL